MQGAGWLTLAPNRLLPGEGIPAAEALGMRVHLLALIAVAGALLPSRGAGSRLACVLLLGGFLIAVIGTGQAASALLEGRPASARVSLGAGFWLAAPALFMLALERARETARAAPAAILALAGLFLAAGAALGLFDALSLLVEYRARQAAFHAALGQHLVLSLGALALALIIAVPLGFLAFRSPRVEAAADAVLGVLQVTPALALFGLLIPMLSGLLAFAPGLRALGLGAIGPAPAVIGVAAYLALPLLRGVVSGLKAADADVVEAARAMGFGESRLTREVRVPLGLGVLIAALRVAAVQSIGFMTLGGLIGAGGLGALVFEGMAQFAPNLILLGALPVIALALAADGALALAARLMEPRA